MTEHALSRNPTTGEILARYPLQNSAELEQTLTESASAFAAWKQSTMTDRVRVLRQLGEQIRLREQDLSRMITLEMGKPIAQARAEVLKCANLCDWYAEHGPAMLADQPTQIADAWQRFRPIGVILAVMPWNFPLWQVLRGAVSMLLAGNTYLLKHAPNVMGSATLMAELFRATDLPAGGFNLINVDNDGVSVAIKDDRIAAVAVTGSVRAGAAIAAQAGAALKKTVLELGGSDPLSCWRMPILMKRLNQPLLDVSRIPGRCVWLPNALLWKLRSLKNLKNASLPRSRHSPWAIRWMKIPSWARWHAPICVTNWMDR